VREAVSFEARPFAFARKMPQDDLEGVNIPPILETLQDDGKA